MAQARVLGESVEDVSQRTASARTFANPDGTWTTEDLGTAVRVARDGEWLDVDLSLERRGDGTWGPRVAPVDVVVAGGGDEAGRVTFEDGSSVAVAWPGGELPEPSIAGGTATFAVSETTDLQIVMASSGMKAWLRVNEPPTEADPTFSLELRSQGVDLVDAHGGLKIRDEDGGVVGSASQFVAWDSRVDAAGDVLETVALEAELDEGVTRRGETSQELVLAAPEGFWQDPDLVFPVIIDPDISFVTKHRDTWVRQGVTATKGKDERLLVGATGGGNEARSLLKWQEGQLVGKDIVSATMTLYQYYADSCSVSITTEVRRLAAGFTEASTVWTNMPGMDGLVTTFAQNRGADQCSNDNGPVTVPLTGLVTGWASGAITNYGIVLRPPAANATNSNYGKRFCSFDFDAQSTDVCRFADRRPTLSVTYSVTPTAPAWPSFAPLGIDHAYTNVAAPTVTTAPMGGGGDQVRAQFEAHLDTSGSTLRSSCVSGLVASGTTVSCVLGTSLVSGTTYRVRARTANQHGRVSGWSAWRPMTIDTVAPAMPTVTASGHTNGQWRETAPVSNTFTFTTSSTDVARFQYKANNGAWVSTPVSYGTTSATFAWNPGAGAHSFTVRGVDRAGNVSAERVFTFGWGKSSLQTPSPAGAKVTDRIQVRASAPPPASGSVSAKTQFRLRGGTWTDGTALAVSTSNGATVVNASADVAAFVNGQGRERRYTVVEVQVCFTYTSPVQTRCTWADGGASSHGQLVYVPHAFGSGFPVADAGPGQVALWTGEFKVLSTDVAVPGYGAELTVSRAYSTFTDGSNTGVFGPGWKSSFDGAEFGDANFEIWDDTAFDGTITLSNLNGETLTFAQPGSVPIPQLAGVYSAVDDETAASGARLEVTYEGSTSRLLLTQPGGVVTTWVYSPNGWRPESVSEIASSSELSFTYDSSGRIVRVLAPVPPTALGEASLTCAAGLEMPGCRALAFTYDDTTYAAIDSMGRLTSIVYTAWNASKAGGPGMDTVPVAEYSYDAMGRLIAVADPRPTPSLITEYTWRTPIVPGNVPLLESITPAGLSGYTFGYTTSGGVYNSGLTEVERDPATVNDLPSVISAYRYDVTLSTQGLPDMTASAVEAWGQTQAPSRVFAVLGPGVAGSAPDPLLGTSLLSSRLYFTDDEGRVINTAAHGAGEWNIDAVIYDNDGRIIRKLDARAIAHIRKELSQGGSVNPDQFATITRYNAAIYSSVDIQVDYTSDPIPAGTLLTPAGTYVTDVWDPVVETVGPDGSVETSRTHLHFEYDEGAPNHGVDPTTGLPFRLPTSTTMFRGLPSDGQSDPDIPVDPQRPIIMQSKTEYSPIDNHDVVAPTSGWILRTPTRQIVDAEVDGFGGSDDIVTQFRYDSEGKEVESREPLSTGLDGGTNFTAYYTAAAQSGELAQCGRRGEWAGEVCLEWTGAGVHAGSKRISRYSMYMQSDEVVEAAGGGVRTTTILRDSLDRPVKASVTSNGVVGSVPVPDSVFEYDPANGLHIATTSVGPGGTELARVEETRDLWGRVVEYTGSDGESTTTVFDEAGRVAVRTTPQNTTSYTYDSASEHRGLATTIDISDVGTFTAEYDAGGALVKQVAPGGISQSVDIDRRGRQTGLHYSIDGIAFASWTQTFDVLGRVAKVVGPSESGASRESSFVYDGVARLVKVVESENDSCTQRDYSFDADGNRTGLVTAVSPTNCESPATTVEVSAWTYDDFGRVQYGKDGVEQYSYDSIGRQTLLPASDTMHGAPHGGLAIVYHDDDAVRELVQGGRSTIFERDALGRLSRSLDRELGVDVSTTDRHYSDASDAVAWVDVTTSEGVVTTVFSNSASADLSVARTSESSAILFADPRGNIVTSVVLEPGYPPAVNQLSSFDEYGRRLSTGTSFSGLNYSTLGSSRIESSDYGIVHAGARLLNPVTGLFTSPDSVAGGNATAYGYPSDPINARDTDGNAAVVVVAWPLIVLLALFALALYLALMELVTRCNLIGCGIAIPSVSIPWPSPKAKSAKKYRKSSYMVYEIYRIRGRVTFKFGITRQSTAKRPKGQIRRCEAFYGESCSWSEVGRVTGWFAARTMEATLITAYYQRHGHCPPGQLLSCR